MYIFKGNNRATKMIDDNQHFILHSTSIVILKSKSIVLNNGGYQSATTKKAMNEVGAMLGFSVSQKAGVWYVNCNDDVLEFHNNMEFHNGIGL